MARAVVLVGLMLAGCAPQVDKTERVYVDTGEWVDAALAEPYEYYPQPDFDSERVFRATDQFGCDWWLTSGHKFDNAYPVLVSGDPVCKEGTVELPPKTLGYRVRP